MRLTIDRPGPAAPDAVTTDAGAHGSREPAVAGRGRRRRTALVAAAVVVATFAGAATLAVVVTTGAEGACACSTYPSTSLPADALGPGTATVRLGVEHSRFTGGDLTVVAGTEVTFVLDNGDPIGHELIVGPPEVHERHAGGHEAWHPPRAGEVSVGPNGEAETTWTFDEPGEVEFACHLPGHYDFGMHGTITVVPA